MSHPQVPTLNVPAPAAAEDVQATAASAAAAAPVAAAVAAAAPAAVPGVLAEGISALVKVESGKKRTLNVDTAISDFLSQQIPIYTVALEKILLGHPHYSWITPAI